MTGIRRYPDEPTGGFATPPGFFSDAAGRDIKIGVYDTQSPRDGELEALVRMYTSFDPADRAQGIPPRTESAIRDWLDQILAAGSVHLIAWHEDRIVGHAALVSECGDEYELAIFVHQDYQQARIGSRLLDHLLGEAADRGIERVWLTVERWNEVAIRLYRKMGFETVGAESFELEMGIRLLADPG